MKRLWFNNKELDRLAMLQQTEAEHSGINQAAIEKDWWVTVTLKALFQCACSDSLTFKGGQYPFHTIRLQSEKDGYCRVSHRKCNAYTGKEWGMVPNRLGQRPYDYPFALPINR